MEINPLIILPETKRMLATVPKISKTLVSGNNVLKWGNDASILYRTKHNGRGIKS